MIAIAAGWHPAMREGAPLAGLAFQIAADAKASEASLAYWLLDLSLLYIAGWCLFALCPRRTESRSRALPVLVAAIAGQAAACFAKTPTAFYFVAAGVATLGWRPTPATRAPLGRLVLASAVGLLLVALASPLDTGLARLTGAGLLPSAWFPLYVEFDTGHWIAGSLLGLVIVAACAALGFARGSFWVLAPACVLVLGPSNPAKGLAVGLALSLLARLGAPPAWRAAFAAATVGVFLATGLAL